jgi:DNA-binding MarR family transcriptional regulator
MSNAATENVTIPRETVQHVGATCLCLYARRAARALARRFDEAFRPLGITNGQFSMMMILSAPEPRAMGETATMLAMDRTTLTAALKPLEKRGLVKVMTKPGDRRGRLLTLTPEGHALLMQAVPIWERTHAELDAMLPAGAGDDLRASLRILSHGGTA